MYLLRSQSYTEEAQTRSAQRKFLKKHCVSLRTLRVRESLCNLSNNQKIKKKIRVNL